MPNRNKIEVPITGGMRQDLSEHNAPVGTLVDALNVRFAAVGEVEARPGTTALSMATDTDVTYAEALNGVGLLKRIPGGFLLGTQGYGFRYDFGKDRLHVGGSYGNAEPLGIFETIAREELQLASGKSVPWPLSQVAVNGYVATVYSNGNGQPIGDGAFDVGQANEQSMVLHVRTEAGALVLTANLSSISAAWLVADGSSSTSIILVYQNATTGLSARIITTSATGATLGSAVAVGTLTSSTSFWAACFWTGIGWVLVHRSAATTVTITALAGTGSLDTATFAVVGNVPVSVFATAANVYVGWVEGSVAPFTSEARVYNTTLDLTSGVGSITLATEAGLQALGPPLFGPSTTSTSAMFVISRSVDERMTDDTYMRWGELTATGTIDIAQIVYQCTAASAPFANGYVWVRAGSNEDTHDSRYSRNLLLDFMGMRASATGNGRSAKPVIALSGNAFANGETNTYPGGFYLQHLSAPTQLSDGTYIMGLPRLVRLNVVNGDDQGLAIAEWFKFSIGGTRQAVPYGNTVIVAGFPTLLDAGMGTRAYDGTNSFVSQRDGIDLGFPCNPGITTPTVSNGSGQLTSSATYQWRAVLERIDASGRRWRSAPSAVATQTTGASDDTAALIGRASTDFLRAIGGSAADRVGSRFVMHFYRTVANGSTFYRCTPPQGAPTDAGDGEFTFTDGTTDTRLQTNEVLYTDGGVLDNDCPPSCRFIAATEDRIWLAGLWETEQLQSSKILVPGEPPQFSDSPAFRVVLPEPCTGIAVQDGVVVAFSETSVYAIQGGGPSDQGQGAWDSPRCITNSTGCIASQSILVTSLGIFFQSEQGIEIIPRGMGEPQFVGMPVQDVMFAGATRLNVVSAAVVTTLRGRSARFLIETGGITSLVLVYDLDTQAWSRDSYTGVALGVTDTDEGAVIAQNSLSSGYGALIETSSEDRDSIGNSPAEITSSLEWCALRPFGVAGQGRFTGATALFDAKTSPSGGYRSGTATIKLTTDKNSETGMAFNMNTLSGAVYRKHVPKQDVGTAGLLTLETTVAGWRFVGWSVEVDSRGGGRRMGETEQG